jgi:hypothetical protein
MSDTSSLGPRLNEVEKELAVHEAVCAERYQHITGNLEALRIELAARAARQEVLLKAITALLIALTGLLEVARRWFG